MLSAKFDYYLSKPNAINLAGNHNNRIRLVLNPNEFTISSIKSVLKVWFNPWHVYTLHGKITYRYFHYINQLNDTEIRVN